MPIDEMRQLCRAVVNHLHEVADMLRRDMTSRPSPMQAGTAGA